jgi:hypothetical protein
MEWPLMWASPPLGEYIPSGKIITYYIILKIYIIFLSTLCSNRKSNPVCHFLQRDFKNGKLIPDYLIVKNSRKKFA